MTISAERRVVIGHVATRIIELADGVRVDDALRVDHCAHVDEVIRVDEALRVDGGVRIDGGLDVCGDVGIDVGVRVGSGLDVRGDVHVDCRVHVDGGLGVGDGVHVDDGLDVGYGVHVDYGIRVDGGLGVGDGADADSGVHVDRGVAGGGGLRIGVDGVDGAGKSVFADELAVAIRSLGRPVVRVSLDDFHHVRAIRYRQGRDSPQGFWQDSYDYERFQRDVLDPFAPGGSRRYRPAAHDLETDAVLDMAPRLADPASVLVVDGLFLHRDELAGTWDLSVFLDVPFEETARRMADRDGTSPDPDHPGMRRYVQGQRLYFAACSPQRRATILIDNRDFDAPRIIRGW